MTNKSNKAGREQIARSIELMLSPWFYGNAKPEAADCRPLADKITELALGTTSVDSEQDSMDKLLSDPREIPYPE